MTHARLLPAIFASTVAFSAAAGAAPAGQRMHKPLTVTTPAAADTTAPAPALSCAAVSAAPVNVASDPEEGGQIARTAKAKPTISEIKVAKVSDKASPTLAQSAPPAGTSCAPDQR